MKATIITTTVLATLIVSPIWRGYALSKLWLWFIVSTFGAAPLGIAQSIGLALIVSFLTHQPVSYKEEKESVNQKLVYPMLNAFLIPALTLFIGWIVKGFLG
jgi:putative flippase GtrA